MNDTIATIAGNTFSAVVPIGTGVNESTTIVARALADDSDCEPLEDSVVVIHNDSIACTDPLTLIVTAPKNGKVTTSSRIVVAGEVSDHTAEVRVNGNLVDVKLDGSFETRVALARGNNDIVVTASNNDPDCDQTVEREVDKRNG